MELTIDRALQQGVAAHKEGKLQDAERLYRVILQAQPQHPDANHNLGVLAMEVGKPLEARPFFRLALDANPKIEQFWLSYIDVLMRLERFEEAKRVLVEGERSGVSSDKLDALTQRLRGSIPHDTNKVVKVQTLSEKRRKLAEHKKSKKKKPQGSPSSTGPSQDQINRLVAHYQAGRFEKAEPLAVSLTQEFPKHPFGWKVLGAVFKQMGRLSESLAPKQKAAELSPHDAVAHSNLSVTLQDLGRLDEAEASCRQAIALKPSLAEAHSNLGNTLRNLGKLDESEASCRQAIALKLGYAEAHYNLGVTLQDLGRLSEAEASHRKAIALKPGYAKAHNNLGNTLKELERLAEAEASYRKAIALKPDFADAYNNLGATLKELARLDESEASYKQAIEMKPNFAEAHYNLGNTLRDLGRHDESEASYKRAIAVKPDFAEAYNNLGAALKDLGRLDEAIGSFNCASALEPDSLVYWCNANLYFSRVHHQIADIEREREKYSRAIRMLEGVSGKPSEDRLPVNTQSFYLAYHNFNDTKAVLVRLQCALREAPIARGLIFHADEKPLAEKAEKKITVGICSSFLGSHTIGFLYRGLIEELAAKGLAITLLLPSESKRNDVQATIELAASKVINLSSEPLNAARQIAEANLDFLFYPDIGMSPMTYQLALSRLAPVQATSWGHPITTGLDTMDYFISSELLEPPDAQDHYSEQLIQLSKLPCIYRVPELPTIPKDRHSLGMPEHPLLIGIPQSLFKFHPDFDTVLETVALALPDARLILIRDRSDIVTNQLKERWRQRAPQLINQTIFLPRMKREDFLGMLNIVDFLLDPIYFGSGNTFYEAMIFGTPIVTLPGKTLSGRVVLGGYRQMHVENPPVANSIVEFVRLAVELASDNAALKSLKSTLRDAASRYLWDDTQVADEFAAFVTASVGAAERGNKVPPDWQANRSLIDQ